MPIPALPSYLRTQDFSTASPGLRFGMYLPLWGVDSRSGETLWTTHDINYRQAGPNHEERRFQDENKSNSLHQAVRLGVDDQARLKALAERQAALAGPLEIGGEMLVVDGLAVAPFTTGLGNEHPLENGFAFLNPYGLPYLPGSGVKGVLRQAARELARGEWGGTQGWGRGETFPVQVERNRFVDLSLIDAMFGLESADGGADHVRGALRFWDVVPQIKGDGLQVEVMTAHHTDYFQHSKTPHDSESPNPINFLTVPPGSRFTFHVQCDLSFLCRHAPALAEAERWQDLLRGAFAHAFEWLGFGAKTAVGYGAMHADEAAGAERRAWQKREAEEAAERERKARRLASMSPLERQIAEFLDARSDKNQSEVSALVGALKSNRWTGDDRVKVAADLKGRMERAGKWKPESNAKKPEKDKDLQNTRLVMSWIDGKA